MKKEILKQVMDPVSTPVVSQSSSKKINNKGGMKRVFKIGCFSVLGLFVLVTFIVIGSVAYNRARWGTFNDFCRMSDSAVENLMALDIAIAYNESRFAADLRFKRKIVTVSGQIIEFIDSDGMFLVVLDGIFAQRNVVCQIQEKQVREARSKLRRGQVAIVVGTVIGLLESYPEVHIIECLVFTEEWLTELKKR